MALILWNFDSEKLWQREGYRGSGDSRRASIKQACLGFGSVYEPIFAPLRSQKSGFSSPHSSSCFVCLTAQKTGGERGIRTLVPIARKHDFESCAIDHSAISPRYTRVRIRTKARHFLPSTPTYFEKKVRKKQPLLF